MSQFTQELLLDHEVNNFGQPVKPKNSLGVEVGDESLPFTNELIYANSNPLPQDFTTGVESNVVAANPDKLRAPLRVGDDFSERQHELQGYGELAGRSLARLVGGIIAKGASGLGFLSALSRNLVTGAFDGRGMSQIITDSIDNSVSTLFDNWEQDLKERFAIFDSNQYKYGTFGQQIFTSKFWADEAIDGLAFMASTYVPGGLLSKAGAAVGVAAKAVKAGHKLSSALRATAIGRATIPKLVPVVNAMNKASLIGSMTAMEAMFEAKGIRDAILNDPDLQKTLSPEELQKRAADAARDTFAMNMGALWASNLVEVSALTKLGKAFAKPGNVGKASRAKRGIKYDPNTGKASVPELKGLAKAWNSDAAVGVRDIIATAAAEGLFEENIQNTIEQLNHRRAEEGLETQGFLDSMGILASEFFSTGKEGSVFNFESDDKKKAVLLGALLGGGTTTLLNASGRGAVGENREKRKRSQQKIEDINNSSPNLTKLDIFDHEPDSQIEYTIEPDGLYRSENGTKTAIDQATWDKETKEHGIDSNTGGTVTIPGEVIIDQTTGKPQVNQQKLNAWVSHQQNLNEINSLIEALSTKEERNQTVIALLENEKIAVWARAHFDAGLGEELQDRIDYMAQMTDEEVSFFGTPRENRQQYIQEVKDYVNELEELYDSVDRGIITPRNADATKAVKYREMVFDVGGRMIAMNNVVRKLESDNITLKRNILVPSFDITDPTTEEVDSQPVNDMQQSLMTVQEELRQLLAKENPTDEDIANIEELNNKADVLDQTLKTAIKNKKQRDALIQNHPNNLAIARNNVKIKQINEANTKLSEEWARLTDLTKGFQYFSNNQSILTQKYNEKPPNTIILNSTTKTKEFEKYLAKQVQILKIKDQFNEITSAQYDDILTSNTLTRDEILPFIKEIQEQLPSLSPEAINVLASYIRQYQEIKNQNRRDIKRLKRELDDANTEEDTFTAAEVTEKLNEQLQLRDDIAKKNTILEDFSQNWDTIKEELSKRSSIKTNPQYEVQVVREKFMRETDRLGKLVEDPKFTGLDDINRQITRLKALKRLTKGDNFTSLQSTMEKDIKSLTQWGKEVQERLQDRALQAHRVISAYSTSIENGLLNFPEIREEIERQVTPQLYATIMADAEASRDTEGGLGYINPLYFQVLLEHVSEPEKLTPLLDKRKDELVTALRETNIAKSALSRVRSAANMDAILTGMRDNPDNNFHKFVRQGSAYANSSSIDAEPDSPVTNYLIDRDIVKFVEGIKGQDRSSVEISSEEFEIAAGMYLGLKSLNLIQKLSNSQVSTGVILTNQLKRAKKSKDAYTAGTPFDFAPTLQQDIAIHELVNFFYEEAKTEGNNFENWMVLFGFSATGKTSVVADQALKLANLDPSEVYATGHSEESTKNLSESIGATTKGDVNKLISDLTDGSIPSDITTLVIDEIAFLDAPTLNKLASAVAAAQKASPARHFKVLALGDPNQISSSVVGPAIAQIKGSARGTLQNIENLRTVTPLTIKLRSDVPIINDVQDRYLGKRKAVEGVVGKVNVPIKEITATTTPLLGAFLEQGAGKLVSILKNSRENHPNRTRAIVVKTAAQAAHYETKLNEELGENHGVEIFTAQDVQGLTRDEVYVDIVKESKDRENIINDMLHVATSRPKSFLYVGNAPKSETHEQTDMEDQVEKNKTEKVDNFDAFIEKKTADLAIYKKYGEIPTQETTTQETAPVEESKTEEEVQVEEKEQELELTTQPTPPEKTTPATPIEQVEPTDTAEEEEAFTFTPEPKRTPRAEDTEAPSFNVHTFAHPEEDAYRNIVDGDGNIIFPALDFTRDEDKNWTPGLLSQPEVPVEYHMIDGQLTALIKHNNMYRRIAVLSAKDIATHPHATILQAAINSGKDSGLTKVRGQFQRGLFEGDASPVAEGRLSSTSKGITYEFSAVHVPLDGTEFGNLFAQWEHQFTEGEGLANSNEVRQNLTINIFTEGQTSEMRGKAKENEFIPDPGVPYLIIKNYRLRKNNNQGGAKSKRTQYIKLSARRLNANRDQELIEPIREFNKDTKMLSAILAEMKVKASLGDRVFDQIVYALSDFSQKWGKLKTSQYLFKDYGHILDIFGINTANKSPQQAFEELFELPNFKQAMEFAADIDGQVHGTWEFREKKAEEARQKKLKKDPSAKVSKNKYASRNFLGEAQRAADRIARANLMAITGRKENGALRGVTLRDYRKMGKGENQYSAAGRGLLGPVNAEEAIPIMVEKLRDDVEKFIHGFNKRREARGEAPVDQIDPLTPKQPTFNNQELDIIFGDNAFDANGDSAHKEGFGLRYPINIQSTQSHDKTGSGRRTTKRLKPLSPTNSAEDNAASKELLSNLETNFKSVTPTQITVIHDSASGIAEAPTVPSEPDPIDQEDDFDADFFAAEKARIPRDEIGKEVTPEDAQSLINRIIPSTFKSIFYRLIGKKTPTTRNAMRMVDSLVLTKMAGKEVWGLFKDGVQLFEQNQRGNTYENIVKHETFHSVVNTYLTLKEYNQMMTIARRDLGYKGTDIQVEEQLAEHFQSWKLSEAQAPSKLEKIWRKILNFFGFSSRNFETIDQLFKQINEGRYGGVARREASGTMRTMVKINQEYGGNYDLFLKSRSMFLYHLHKIKNNPRKFGVMDLEEAQEATFRKLKAKFTRLEGIRNGIYKDGGVTEAQELSNSDLEYLAMFSPLFAEKFKFSRKDKNRREFLEHIYPGLHKEDIDDGEMSEIQLDGEETQDDAVSKFFQYFTANQDTIDHRMKLVGLVKEALLAITYKNAQGKQDFVSFGKAFNMLAYGMQGIDTRNITNMSNHIQERILEENGRNNKEANAVADFVETLFNRLKQYDKTQTFQAKDRYIIASENAHQGIGVQRVIERRTDPTTGKLESTNDFIDYIAQETGESRENLIKYYQQYEAKQLVSSMVSTIGSLREKNPMAGTNYANIKTGNRQRKYFESRGSSMSNTMRTNLLSTIINETEKSGLDTKKTYANPISNGLRKKLRASINSTDIQRSKVISEILIKLGMIVDPIAIPKYANATIAKRLSTMLDAMGPRVKSSMLLTIENDYNTLFKKLGGVLAGLDKGTRATNFLRADGKTAYRWIRSTYAHTTMDWFVKEKGEYKGQTKPTHLNTEFMSHNIYNGENRGDELVTIHQVVDHDGITKFRNDKRATMYTHESPADWDARNFLYQFVAFSGAGSEGGRGKYVQSFWTISNKPTMTGAVVDILDTEKSDTALDMMLAQEASRPEKDLKTYNPRNYLLGETKEEIKDILEEDAREFLRNLNSQGQLFTEELFAAQDRLATQGLLHGESVQGITRITKDTIKARIAEEHGLEEFPEGDADFKAMLNTAWKSEEIRAEREQNLDDIIKGLLPLAKTFITNYYIQSHQLNQLVLGDQAHYKNALDIVKRISISFGPGMRPFVHKDIGTKQVMNVAIANDLEHDLNYIEGLAKHLVKEKSVDVTDAQGYITPAAFAQLNAGYGAGQELDTTLKPVYYGIGKDGTPIALKFSLVVLSDELVNDPQFIRLKELREQMEKEGKDILTFDSATKVGAPRKKDITRADGTVSQSHQSQFNKETTGFEPNNEGEQLRSKGTVQIEMENFRLQLNPSHDVKSELANPTQLLYFSGVWNKTQRQSTVLQKSVANIVRAGNRELALKFLISDKGKASGATKQKLRGHFANSFSRVAGSELESELLSHNIKGNGKQVSMDLPILTNKVIASIASLFKKGAIRFKIRGADLVLQSEAFTYKDLASKLKWRNENGNAEALVPRQFEKLGYKVGDIIYGFRLPSTGIHSSAPVEIKGFMDGSGKNNNLIVLPSEVTKFHGADYDIDILHTIYKEFWNEDYDLTPILQELAPTIFTEKKVLKEGSDLISEIPFFESVLELIETARDQAREKIGNSTNPDLKAQLRARMERLEQIELPFLNYYKMANRNQMVDTYIEMSRHPDNRELMLNTVSMDRFNGTTLEGEEETVSDMMARLKGYKGDPKDKDARNQYLLGETNLSRVKDQNRVHFNTFSGNTMTGLAAKFAKGVAHIVMAAKPSEYIDPATGKTYSAEVVHGQEDISKETGEYIHERVPDGLEVNAREEPKLEANGDAGKVTLEGINIDGHVYDTITSHEYVGIEDGNKVLNTQDLAGNKKTYSIWESIDSLINAAIDNVKEQILAVINLTDKNGSAFLAGVALGIPVKKVVKIFSQPSLLYITKHNFDRLTDATIGSSMTFYENKITNRVLFNKIQETFPDMDVDSLREELSKRNEVVKILKERFMGQELYVYLNNPDTIKEIQDEVDSIKSGSLKEFEMDKVISETWDQEKLTYVDPDTMDFDATQYQALRVAKGLLLVGTNIDNASEAVSIVKDIPITYHEIKKLRNLIQTKVADFDISKLEGLTDRLTDTLFKRIENSATYKEIEDPVKAAEFMKEAFKRLSRERSIEGRLRNRSITNSLFHARGEMATRAADPFLFKNANLLKIPNIYQSFVTLLSTERVIETTIMRNSQAMSMLSEVVTKQLDLSHRDDRGTEELQEHIRAEFFKYMLSDLKIDTAAGRVDLNTENETPFKRGSREFKGFTAFTERLAFNLLAAKGDPRNVNNQFLTNLTIDNKTPGSLNIVFTADKTSDPLESVMFKNYFRQMNHSSEPWSQLQLDLLKYAILKDGLAFGRTKYTRVLPEELLADTTESLNTMIETLFESDDSIELSEPARMILDDFMLQFVKNNSETLANKKNVLTKVGDNTVEEIESLDSNDKVRTFKLYHDATMSYSNPKSAPMIVRAGRYLYARVWVGNEKGKDGKTKVYYRKFSRSFRPTGYKLHLDRTVEGKGLDLPGVIFIPWKPSILSTTIDSLDNIQYSKIRQSVLIIDPEEPSLSSIKTAQIKGTEIPSGSRVNPERIYKQTKNAPRAFEDGYLRNSTITERLLRSTLNKIENSCD